MPPRGQPTISKHIPVGIRESLENGIPPDDLVVRIRQLVETAAGDLAEQKRIAEEEARYQAIRDNDPEAQ